MKVKYSFVCDAANVTKSGNLNVLGIFKEINTTKFPVKCAKFSYVSQIEFHRSETGKHNFKLNFINEDGKEIIPSLNGVIAVGDNSYYSNLLINLENITFPVEGVYAIDLTVNNQHLATDLITLKLVK